MASDWSANLDDVKTESGNVVLTITFTNAATKETVVEKLRGDDISPARLGIFAYQKIASLDARDSSKRLFVPGPITPRAPTPRAI